MGNTSSPAIANLAVRYAAREFPPENGAAWIVEDDIMDPYQLNRTRQPDEVERSLANNFYVDDFLASESTPQKALRLIQEGVRRFKRYSLKLCKVQSNEPTIRDAFPSDEPRPRIMSLSPGDPTGETLSKGHSSLGLQWDIEQDTLQIKIQFKDRPFTKRGLLGHIMMPYDPFGIAQPAMLMPKLLQREIIPNLQDDPHDYHRLDWDDELPDRLSGQWKQMLRICTEVQRLKVSRSYYPPGHGIPIAQT